MHAHTGVFGPAVRTNASRLGREVRNGGYPVWAICRLQAVLFYIFNRFDDIKLLVRRQPTEIGEKPIPQRRHFSLYCTERDSDRYGLCRLDRYWGKLYFCCRSVVFS